jgi:hypothetical protein
MLVLYVTVDHLHVVRSCCRLHDMHAFPSPSTEILLVAHFAYVTKSDSKIHCSHMTESMLLD